MKTVFILFSLAAAVAVAQVATDATAPTPSASASPSATLNSTVPSVTPTPVDPNNPTLLPPHYNNILPDPIKWAARGRLTVKSGGFIKGDFPDETPDKDSGEPEPDYFDGPLDEKETWQEHDLHLNGKKKQKPVPVEEKQKELIAETLQRAEASNLPSAMPSAPPVLAPSPPAVPASPAPKPISWSYKGARLGPRNWANLSPKFVKCATGTSQSPINIVEVVDKEELPSLRTERLYASRVSLYNSGRGAMVAVLPRNYNGVIDIGGRVLQVHKVRFHAQSEHQIRGTAFPLEAQIVTRSSSGTVVIISVLFMMGAENPVLAKVWDEFEAVKGVVKSKNSLDIGLLLRSLAHGGYYTYEGSLPYPPCFEGVEWIVMRSPLTVSKRQVKYFTFRANGKNWRDIMPKNGRTVYASARDPPENLPPTAESGSPPRS